MTLPKFLLAWADWSWIPFLSKLRPAKEARWSPVLTLGLTLMAGGLGALVGLLFALGFLHRPAGWLPWLMGLWWGCIGLCRYGVTGLCWNQRAAQLQANPALLTTLPKARFRFFRWCLGFIYLVLLVIITPIALVVTVENIRGEIAWKREHARLVAAGEKLTLREIHGPEVAAAQNAGAAAIFAPLFDYHTGKPTLTRQEDGEAVYTSGLIWGQSNQVERLERIFRTPASYLPQGSKGSAQEPTTPRIKMSDWSAAYRKLAVEPTKDDAEWSIELKLPPVGDPARDVLSGLSLADKELNEVCAAAALPRSRFPTHDGEGFTMLLRHVSVLKGIQQVLQLRCAAHLATGETDAAFADATNALNVADLLREEPLLISQLVRYAQIHLAASTVWQGMADHRWSDTQLAEFQRQLSRFDCPSSIVLAMEGERALGIASMDRMMNDPLVYDSLMGRPPAVLRILRAIPRSILRQNQTAMAHYQTEALGHLRQAISNAPQTGLLAAVQSRPAKLEHYVSSSYSPYTVMFAALAPATGKATEKTARASTVVNLTVTACALERYRLAHGEFPANLEQMSAQLHGQVPPDPMVNQPFHYQRTDDGWYLLYSVGLNGRDDGGVMVSGDRGDKTERDWPWPVPTRPAYPRLF